MQIQSGIPLVNDLLKIQESLIYRELEESSIQFYQKNGKTLSSYLLKWGREPMKNWSRQWEYPFVADQVLSNQKLKGSGEIRVLDAGSGCSFFPYFLANKNDQISIDCFDYDPCLVEVFMNIDDLAKDRVQFSSGDLRHMPFDSETYDLIYCVSVLEHTNQYLDIIKDFHRVLKPGGSLILTIDIAIDDANEIPKKEAQELLDSASRVFDESSKISIASVLSSDNCLTTKWAKMNRAGDLPWLSPKLSAFRAGLKRGKISFFPNLTVFGGSWTKSQL